MTVKEPERRQDEFDATLGALSIYPAKKKKYLEAKNKLLNNAKEIYKRRENMTEGFKNKIFPLNYDEEEQRSRYKEEENNYVIIDYKKLNRLINLKERDINNELVRNHFLVQDLGALLKKLKNPKIIQKGIIFR